MAVLAVHLAVKYPMAASCSTAYCDWDDIKCVFCNKLGYVPMKHWDVVLHQRLSEVTKPNSSYDFIVVKKGIVPYKRQAIRALQELHLVVL